VWVTGWYPREPSTPGYAANMTTDEKLDVALMVASIVALLCLAYFAL
jgi:hypothetical protein